MSQDANTLAAQEPRIIALKSYVQGRLEPRIKLVFSELVDHLFNLSSSSQLTSDSRSRCFEAFSLLNSHGKTLVADTLTHIDAGYNHLIVIDSEEQEDLSGELDLVDIGDFEDNLAIDRIVKLGTERYWIALEAITMRLATIIDTDPAKLRLPFGVRELCTAYRSVIKPMELSAEIIDELDKAFARKLLPELKGTYKEINEKLESEGLLPGVEEEIESGGSKIAPAQLSEASQREKAAAQSQGRTDAAQASTEGAPGQQGGNYGGGYAAPGPYVAGPQFAPMTQPGPGQAHQTSPYLSDMASSQPAHSPQQASQYGQGQGFRLSDALLNQAMLANQAQPIPQSLLDQLAIEQGVSSYLPSHGSSSSATTVNLDVLNRLRSTGDYGLQIDQPSSPSELAEKTEALLGQLVLLQGQGLEQSSTSAPLSDQLDLETLGPEGEVLRGSIALIDKLFETLASPIATNASLTNSFHALKPPLAQLALTDPDFYRNREHPARLLVERLSELQALAPQRNARIEQRLNDIVSRVSADYDGDLDVFDNALEKVTELALTVLRQQQRNIQRQVAAEEGKERRHIALQRVNRDLYAAIPQTAVAGHLNRIIKELLRDDLTLRVLRDEDDEQYATILSTIKTINSALQGDSTLDAEQRVSAIRSLRQCLEERELLTPEYEPLLEQLKEQLLGNGHIEFVDSTYGDRVLFAEPEFSERLKLLARLNRWVRRARSLAVNTWLMETDTHQGSRYLQLIWINLAETRFALANEQGQKVYDFDLIAFARALAKNMRPLKQSEQLSVVERSVFSTLEEKQADLTATNRASMGEELSRTELIDQVQSMLRRARRKGPSHAALAIHADAPDAPFRIIGLLEKAGLTIDARGLLSPSTWGLVVQTDSIEQLQSAVKDQLGEADTAGIGIAVISATYNYADALWKSLAETAQRGLSLSPNIGVVAPQENRQTDLAGAVRKTYGRLKDDMPPRFSLRRVQRSRAGDPSLSEDVFQVLLDGTADAAAEVSQQTGYHSAALSIALDCVKVNATCAYAEKIVNAGRELPVFHVKISTDSALHNEFLDFILGEVSDSGIGTDRLCIELRDSARLREADRAADFARTLRSIGCQISVSEVHPSRGSTAQLQTLSPHMLALDASLWPPGEDNKLSSLNQAISDLHHLVGEHVVLRDSRERVQATELGIDIIEIVDSGELDPQQLLDDLPHIQR